MHLKMMRSLFLCLLLLPVAVVALDNFEGSAFDEEDDEDAIRKNVVVPSHADKTKNGPESADQVTIIVVAVVAVVALLAIIVIAMFSQKLCRCNQERNYAMPEEQNKKGAV